jgi:hypothetical protein
MKAYCIPLLLLCALACGKPLCNVEVSEPGRWDWFGPDAWPGLASSESFMGKIFLMPVDLDLLHRSECLDCQAQLESLSANAFEQAVAEGSKGAKAFTVVRRREDAEYLVFIKISKVTSFSKLHRLLSPLALESHFGYWLKVVDPRNNKTVFAYQDYVVSFSARDLQGTAHRLGLAIVKQKVN